MKKLLSILLLCFCLSLSAQQTNNLYHIQDTAFLSWLQENHPDVIVNDSLDINNALEITSLEILQADNIINLDGLQFFLNLNYLELWNNDLLTNLSGLSELSNLEYLEFHTNNSLTSLPDLMGLSSLNELQITGNASLTSLPDLSGLNNLSWLYIGFNDLLLTLPELSDLTNLETAYFRNNNFVSFPEFDNLISLEFLQIMDNQYLTHIPNLSNINNLTSLSITGNNNLAYVPDLSGLINLISVGIYDNPLITCIPGYPEQSFVFNLSNVPPICEVDILDQLNQSFDAWNVSIDLSEGWNMFGYGCPNPIDVIVGLSNHTESILITKDNNGAVYMPEWDFNGIGDLTPGFGYQIKVSEYIEDFSLCENYINDVSANNLESILEELSSNSDSLLQMNNNIVSLQDSLALINSQIGCTDSIACNFAGIYEDGSCEYAEQGYSCDGFINAQIGDYFEGGIVFYLEENGQHGLVAAMEDLPVTYQWGCTNFSVNGSDGVLIGTGYQNTLDIDNQGCTSNNGGYTAAQASLNYQSDGFSDWYLPSINELIEYYNNIGCEPSNWYWSSSEYTYVGASNHAFIIMCHDGHTEANYKGAGNLVIPIRSF
mgnify:CR=1 FL=1